MTSQNSLQVPDDGATADSNSDNPPQSLPPTHEIHSNSTQQPSSETSPPTYSPRHDEVLVSSGYKVLLLGFSDTFIWPGSRGRRPQGSGSFSPRSSDRTSTYYRTDNYVAALPWGGNLEYYGYGGRTELQMPMFTKLIGIARSPEDIDLSGSELYEIPLQREYTEVDGVTLRWVTHIAIRKPEVQSVSRIVARRTAMVGGNAIFGQVCESGPSLKSTSIVYHHDLDYTEFAGSNMILLHDSYSADVIITSRFHRVVDLAELKSSTVHAIPTVARKESIEEIRRFVTYNGSIRVHLWYLPVVTALFGICLWILPGLLQWLGGEDRNWASIVNQCIGTGSVLLGVVIYLSRKFFSHHHFRDAMVGKVELKNDLAAKLLASRKVRKLESLVYDPRFPKGIVADGCSSAVRTYAYGWLRIGRSIPVRDAKKHGYHVLMDKGVILDLFSAKIYKMETTENGDETILSDPSQSNWKPHKIDRNARIV